MIEANKFKLGLFVIIGFLIFMGMLFFLGLSEIFEKTAHMVSLFNESVQGLAVGSSVNYKGVPIGKVSRISIRTKDKLIKVDMEINLAAFDTNSKKIDASQLHYLFYNFLRGEIKKGLRCQLNYAGITGMKYIEIDYFAKGKASEEIKTPPPLAGDDFHLPSTPSIFKDILKLINDSLEKISKIPFENLSDELTDTFKSAKKLLNDPKIRKTIDKLETASEHLESSIGSFNKALTEQKLKQIINEWISSLRTINKLAAEAQTSLRGAKIPETSERFRNASKAVSDLRRNLSNTLRKFDQTLDSITELVNYLDDDPSSLLRGKQKPETINKVYQIEKERKEE